MLVDEFYLPTALHVMNQIGCDEEKTTSMKYWERLTVLVG